jgi:hypothetical protein
MPFFSHRPTRFMRCLGRQPVFRSSAGLPILDILSGIIARFPTFDFALLVAASSPLRTHQHLADSWQPELRQYCRIALLGSVRHFKILCQESSLGGLQVYEKCSVVPIQVRAACHHVDVLATTTATVTKGGAYRQRHAC